MVRMARSEHYKIYFEGLTGGLNKREWSVVFMTPVVKDKAGH